MSPFLCKYSTGIFYRKEATGPTRSPAPAAPFADPKLGRDAIPIGARDRTIHLHPPERAGSAPGAMRRRRDIGGTRVARAMAADPGGHAPAEARAPRRPVPPWQRPVRDGRGPTGDRHHHGRSGAPHAWVALAKPIGPANAWIGLRRPEGTVLARSLCSPAHLPVPDLEA